MRQKKSISFFIVLLALAFSLTFPATYSYSQTTSILVEKDEHTKKKEVEMAAIAFCESTNRHFDENGEVLRGVVDSRDIGRYQINEYYWGEKAEELGFNIYDEEGNHNMAEWIYDKHGLQPWYASEPCWGKRIHKYAYDV